MAEFDDFDITSFLGIFTLTLTLFYLIYQWCQRKSYNIPPGPMGLPLIGYVPFLGKYPNVTLRDLSKKYGDIFSFKIGPQLMICVNDYHLIKEIMCHPMTLARPPNSFDFLVGKGGFSGLNGDAWHEQRRFVLWTMRNLGLGKGLWETMIQEDACDFVNEMKKSSGRPVSYHDPLSISQVSNSLSLLFGRHLDKEAEKEDVEVMRTFGKVLMEHFSSVDIALNLPWLNKVVAFFNFKGFRDFIKLLRRFELIFKKEVDRRLLSKEEQSREDFIGCYLKEIEKRKNDTSLHWFTLDNLLGNLFILFNAGQDSTNASVGWLLLLMAKYPDIQKKVCAEIDQVIGRDGVVYYDDKTKLPYTMATILEMNRYITINPIFPPRYVLEDFTFEGYTIPKGAHIVCNSWAMMHDPRYFDEPMTFKPERFLTTDADKAVRTEGYGPFSFGKRNCPGEGVAMMTMYMYFVSIMQKFTVKPPPGKQPDMHYKFSAGTLPRAQDLCFIER